jgi:hypothetical protein
VAGIRIDIGPAKCSSQVFEEIGGPEIRFAANEY